MRFFTKLFVFHENIRGRVKKIVSWILATFATHYSPVNIAFNTHGAKDNFK